MRRKHQGPGGFIGLAALAVGTAFMVWANIEDFSPEGIGRVGVVVGVLLICAARLEKRTEANEQNYYLGKDIGYEEGFAAAQKEQRPVVVDLDAHRCRCQPGKCEADTQAARSHLTQAELY